MPVHVFALSLLAIMTGSMHAHPQAALQDSFSEPLFRRLHALFSKFDDAVQRRGMFKYQHVGPWYIVACPRAANPFDPAPAGVEVDRLAAEMALLAAAASRPGDPRCCG